jgi:hypothetical protein
MNWQPQSAHPERKPRDSAAEILSVDLHRDPSTSLGMPLKPN